jgi:hypothetical protein
VGRDVWAVTCGPRLAGSGGRAVRGDLAAFAARYPRVWHVIEAEGACCDVLYPAATLRQRAGAPEDNANREDFQRLMLPDGGTAVLRQQLMRDERLGPTLAGSFLGRPDLWRRHIDRHVFFWLSEDRRDRFIKACVRLRTRGQTCTGLAPAVIEIDTTRLLAAHGSAAWFAMFNTGSTVRGGARVRRDETTFRSLRTWQGQRAVELAIRSPVSLAGNVAEFRSGR